MKGKKQPNMVLSPERAQMLLRLTDEDAGKVTKALVAYANTRALPEGFSEVLLFCFNELADDLDLGFAEHNKICERNRRIAKNRTRASPVVTSGNQSSPVVTSGDVRSPLDYLLTGEDGEPIVIYRSC